MNRNTARLVLFVLLMIAFTLGFYFGAATARATPADVCADLRAGEPVLLVMMDMANRDDVKPSEQPLEFARQIRVGCPDMVPALQDWVDRATQTAR